MPDYPENVSVVYQDGTEVPVECKYTGQEDGIDQWLVVTKYDPSQVAKIKAKKLPAKSTIYLPWIN